MNQQLPVRVTLKGGSIYGYPLVVTKDLVLLQDVDDFRLDGYYMLPLRTIKAVRCGKYERVYDRLLAAEGVKADVALRHAVDAESYVGLFRSLKLAGMYAIVETAAQRRRSRVGERTFFLGRIEGIADEGVTMWTFDALGRWDRRPSRAAFDQIVSVQFDTHYINVFSRHVGEPPG